MTVFVPDDLAGLLHLDGGASGLLQHSRRRAIRQRIDAPPEQAVELASRALANGADELLISRTDAVEAILEAVDPATTRLAFDLGAASAALAVTAGAPEAAYLELGIDPMRQLIAGQPRGASRAAFLDSVIAAHETCRDRPEVVTLAVHAGAVHDAGADAATELAYAMATGIDYLRRLQGAADPAAVDVAVADICFRFRVDTELYLEVARLRAARLLWARICEEFGASQLQTTIHAESSARSHASDDVHTNLIRTGIQGFAATLAGCDSLTLDPFEHAADPRDAAFAADLARQQQLLLREESLLHHVQDPCGGAYAVEVMTDRLAREAWANLQAIEGQGGMLAALESGWLQSRVRDARVARQQAIQTRERTLVGTNRFVDPRISRAEQPPDLPADLPPGDGADLTLDPPFLEFTPDGAAFETLRELVALDAPAVQPVLAGDLRVARTRYEFARDYFTAGGYRVLEPIEAAAPVPATAAYSVLCCDDDSQAEALAAIAGDVARVVAGPPRQDLAGPVAAFIHRGDNTLATLRELYLRLHADDEVAG